jgi:glucosamine--fructose-6-phosphate aminotransferase (isomerizing)
MPAEVEKGKHTLPEIINQPVAWVETIELVQAKTGSLLKLVDDVHEVVFTGCGSALNVSLTLAPTFQHFTGIKARAVPSAEIVFFPETVFTGNGNYLVVPISRSGETTETVMACESVQDRGMKILSITCYPESQLAQKATESLVLEPANEKSVVTTQSLTSMVLCGQVMTGIISDSADYLAQLKSLPQMGHHMIEKYHDLGREVAKDERIAKLAFVGSGPYFGLARECQLKLKEMALLPSDAYPLFDYRHGPKSNVDESMLVTVLMSDSARREEITFLKDMKGLNGNILTICDKANQDIKEVTDYLVEVNSDLPEFARGILYMPPVQFMAYYKSLLLGQDPDNPANLTYWVELSEQ